MWTAHEDLHLGLAKYEITVCRKLRNGKISARTEILSEVFH